eukprot:6223-Pelagomonas_calceolata.AAC.1
MTAQLRREGETEGLECALLPLDPGLMLRRVPLFLPPFVLLCLPLKLLKPLFKDLCDISFREDGKAKT